METNKAKRPQEQQADVGPPRHRQREPSGADRTRPSSLCLAAAETPRQLGSPLPTTRRLAGPRQDRPLPPESQQTRKHSALSARGPRGCVSGTFTLSLLFSSTFLSSLDTM